MKIAARIPAALVLITCLTAEGRAVDTQKFIGEWAPLKIISQGPKIIDLKFDITQMFFFKDGGTLFKGDLTKKSATEGLQLFNWAVADDGKLKITLPLPGVPPVIQGAYRFNDNGTRLEIDGIFPGLVRHPKEKAVLYRRTEEVLKALKRGVEEYNKQSDDSRKSGLTPPIFDGHRWDAGGWIVRDYM